jgi:hypothetical protein
MDRIHPLAEVCTGILKNRVFEYGKGVVAIAAIESPRLVRLMINLADAAAMTARNLTFSISNLDKMINMPIRLTQVKAFIKI